MLKVYHHPAAQHEVSIRNMARGSIIINFGRAGIYEMHSDWHEDQPPTTIYVDDTQGEVDPERHPITGTHDFSRVYHGWYHRASDGEGVKAKEGEVALKWAHGPTRVRELERERDNYLEMGDIRGEIVPLLHDYLQTNIAGVNVACLVLQWCGGRPTPDRRLFATQRLELVSAFHKHGWSHGLLQYDDTHHFVVDETDETGNPLRLVDLTYAFAHDCLSDAHAQSCREVDIFMALRLLNL